MTSRHDPDTWVNAVITITVPLDSVRPEDTATAKVDAVAEVMTRLLDSLPDEFEESVASGDWEDVRADRLMRRIEKEYGL